MHAESFLSGDFCRQIAFGEFDVGFSTADDRCRRLVSRRRLAPPHAFVVVGLEAGLAIGSGQKSFRHGGSIGAKELGSGDET